MSFNNTLIEYLDKRIASKTVPHSLLFAGSNQSPKQEAALQFALRLLGHEGTRMHPDLFIFEPEGKLGLHTIETLRTLRDEVYLPPYESKRKVFIIKEAERMATPSANALLKSFEEPLSTSFILLISSYPEKILPTIRSRCQILYFQEEKKVTHDYPLLLEILTQLDHIAYDKLMDKAQELAEFIEKKSEMAPSEEKEELTATNKQAKEKEREGQEALITQEHVEHLFNQTLGWFRDLHLLYFQGNPALLYHPQYISELQQWIQRGIIPPLDPVIKAVRATKQNLERSSPLNSSLQSFFLALKKIVK